MALVKKRSQTSNILVIFIVVAVLGGIGYVLFRQFYSAGLTNSGNGSDAGVQKEVKDFGQSILQDPRFKSLEKYSTLPTVNSSDYGQGNPFQ